MYFNPEMVDMRRGFNFVTGSWPPKKKKKKNK